MKFINNKIILDCIENIFLITVINFTQIYAIIVDDVFSVLIFFNISRKFWRASQNQKILIFRHLIFFLTLDWHDFFEPWIGINFYIRKLYFGVKAKSIFETKMCANALALINIILFFSIYIWIFKQINS